jgi:type II secretory pathway component PulM
VSIWRRALVEKRRMILPLAIVAIANVVLYAVVVYPLGRHVVSTEQEERASRDQLVRARQDFNNAKATVTGKQQADAALQKFYKDVLPGSESVALRLTYTRLAQLARQANVKLEHGTNAIAREFIVLENISLSSADQQARGVAMNLDIATYFRSGDASS